MVFHSFFMGIYYIFVRLISFPVIISLHLVPKSIQYFTNNSLSISLYLMIYLLDIYNLWILFSISLSLYMIYFIMLILSFTYYFLLIFLLLMSKNLLFLPHNIKDYSYFLSIYILYFIIIFDESYISLSLLIFIYNMWDHWFKVIIIWNSFNPSFLPLATRSLSISEGTDEVMCERSE